MAPSEDLAEEKNSRLVLSLISGKFSHRVKTITPYSDEHRVIILVQFIIINTIVTRGAQADVTRQRSWMAVALKMFWPDPGMTAPAADLTAEL